MNVEPAVDLMPDLFPCSLPSRSSALEAALDGCAKPQYTAAALQLVPTLVSSAKSSVISSAGSDELSRNLVTFSAICVGCTRRRAQFCCESCALSTTRLERSQQRFRQLQQRLSELQSDFTDCLPAAACSSQSQAAVLNSQIKVLHELLAVKRRLVADARSLHAQLQKSNNQMQKRNASFGKWLATAPVPRFERYEHKLSTVRLQLRVHQRVWQARQQQLVKHAFTLLHPLQHDKDCMRLDGERLPDWTELQAAGDSATQTLQRCEHATQLLCRIADAHTPHSLLVPAPHTWQSCCVHTLLNLARLLLTRVAAHAANADPPLLGWHTQRPLHLLKVVSDSSNDTLPTAEVDSIVQDINQMCASVAGEWRLDELSLSQQQPSADVPLGWECVTADQLGNTDPPPQQQQQPNTSMIRSVLANWLHSDHSAAAL